MSTNTDFMRVFNKIASEYDYIMYKELSKSAKINIKNQFKNDESKSLNWKLIASYIKHRSESLNRDLTPKFIKKIKSKFEAWNFMEDEYFWLEDEIDKMIDDIINWCKDNYSTPDLVRKANSKYAKEYDEKYRKPFRMTRAEANKKMKAAIRKKSKGKVLEAVNNLKSRNIKVTIENIHINMSTEEKSLSKARIGVYIKELREENKV
ncbi:hypothetical protein [Arcobacter peruensis]|uniref:hypothetical protein n=1 Tax=Arcobacter peruensis TaxID=2320140 RepID=UPI000F07945C|nr:hypothetical protein [Arcobacter peruensis]